jgi:hypothetical protein
MRGFFHDAREVIINLKLSVRALLVNRSIGDRAAE